MHSNDQWKPNSRPKIADKKKKGKWKALVADGNPSMEWLYPLDLTRVREKNLGQENRTNQRDNVD